MIYYERQRYGDTDPLTIEEWDDLDYPTLHFHGHYEFLCLYGGQLQITLDGATLILNPGQFLLIFPNQIHAIRSLGNAHTRVCIFSPTLINNFYRSTQNQIPAQVICDFSTNVASFINANLLPQNNLFMIKAVLYAICGEINSKTTFVPQQYAKNVLLVHQVTVYISTNFSSDISMHTLAAELGYSYQYLSNQLQKYNLKFSVMLNQYRLDYAKYLLEHTDKAITDIAFLSGYNNLRTFNRNFLKAFRLSPRDYRHAKGISVAHSDSENSEKTG